MLIAKILLLVLIDTLLIIALIDSIKERIIRPILITTAALAASTLFFIILIILNTSPVSTILTYLIFALTAAFTALSLARFFPSPESAPPENITQYDERDNMFSRNNLKHHPDLAADYYTRNPELKQTDQAIHNKTELYAFYLILMRCP